MSILTLFLGLTLFANQPERADITIQIADETNIVPSAHVYVNNSLVGISDSFGKVTLHEISVGDKISITHLAYDTADFSIHSISDTTITLLPKQFIIQEAKYSKDFDYDILRSKMKDGLSGGVHIGKIPVMSKDTLVYNGENLYVLEKGNLSFLLKYYEPVLSGYKSRIIESDDSVKDSIPEEELVKLKSRFNSILSNVQFFTECVCKCNNHKGFRVEYRGSDTNNEIFYFFIPPQDLETYKCRGYIYIDSATGIINHIDVTSTSLSESHLSYDLSVYYQYLSSSNTILPKTIKHIIYYYDKDGLIYQMHRKHLVLDWEHISE